MKAEDFVKQHYPNATIERHRERKPFGGSRTYYLVRKNRGDYMWFSEGDTKSKAWVNAKKKIKGEPYD